MLWVSFTQQAREPPPSERAQSTERTACSTLGTSVRSICKTCKQLFYFCCIQLGSCWARPVLRRIFSPGDINILRVAQMFSHVIGSNVTSHWEVSFMFLFFSKQTYLRTKYLFIAGALPGGVPQFFYHKCRCLGTIWHQKRTNSKEK